jgi:hypothetical protein
MIRKQLLFALRRLGLHKLTTSINILGLTFGILSCLVIYLYVAFEFSYDKFHPDADRIFRVVAWSTDSNGGHGEGAGMTTPLAADLRREATGFSAVTGLYTEDTRVLVPEPGKPVRIIPANGEDERDWKAGTCGRANINAYVKLSPGTTLGQAENQLPIFYKRHKPLGDGEKGGLSLQPLADIHFNSAYNDNYGRRAHKPTLYALAGIALFILVIAAINFINLFFFAELEHEIRREPLYIASYSKIKCLSLSLI